MKRGECAITTDINPAAMPDAKALTETLRAALDETARSVKALSRPEAAAAAAELVMLRDTLIPPGSEYPELPELDDALLTALHELPDLIRLAEADEVFQTVKQLRRMLLSDRRRISPDPRRHTLSLAICMRQARLIAHRSELLTAQENIARTHRMLADCSPGSPEHEKASHHLSLLEQYRQTQLSYAASIRSELQKLQSALQI